MDVRFGLVLTLALGGATELLACAEQLAGPTGSTVVTAATDDVSRVAAVARAIKADPDRAAEVLAAADLTEEELDALLFDIAGDPTKSEAYARALVEEGASNAGSIGGAGTASGAGTARGAAASDPAGQNE